MSKTRVLVIRPEPGASATLNRARELGLEAVCVPLFEIEPVSWNPPDASRFDGLLVTSANAMRLGGQGLRKLRALKVFAVGHATATAARSAGFEIGAIGNSGADRLLSSLESRPLRLLHLCGEERIEPANSGHEIVPLVVYRSKAIAAPDLSRVRDVIALVHSPRAARRFAEFATDKATIEIAAISKMAAAAAGPGWKSLQVALEPTDDALLALASRLCNKPDPE